MAYLAAMALLAHLAVLGLVDRWRTDLTAVVTVEIPPQLLPDGSADLLAKEVQISLVTEILSGTPGVLSVDVIADDHAFELVSDWVGDSLPLDTLPLPALIDVRLDPDAPASSDVLITRLANAAPDATFVDHGHWLGDLERLSATVAGIVAGALGLAVIAGTATVAAVTAAGFAAWRPTIRLLHTLGAEDGYVVRAFVRSAVRQGLWGGTGGIVLSIATVAALTWGIAPTDPELAQIGELGFWAWGWLILVPLATTALAVATTWLTVTVALRRL